MIFYLLLRLLILLKFDQYLAISILGFSCTILNHKGTRSGTNVFSCYECGKVYYSNPIHYLENFSSYICTEIF
jgi:hypothetical protein